jgi:hypothetical protein
VYGYWTNQNRTVSGYPTDNQALATVRLPNCDLNPDGFFRFDSVPDYPNAGNKAVLNFEQCADPTSLITISSSFNGTPINPGNFVWFSGNFKASGLRTDVPTTIYFTDSTITVNGEPHPVASGAITFDPAASCASTEFTLGGWTTVLPTAGSDEILLSGLRLPAIEGIPGGATVSWSARFFSDQPGVKLNWKWGAAVYSSTIDYNAMNVKPTHTNACGIANSDHAGTPETMKAYLTSGARGGGGSNYTGGWTGTLSVTPKPY